MNSQVKSMRWLIVPIASGADALAMGSCDSSDLVDFKVLFLMETGRITMEMKPVFFTKTV